MPRTRTMVILGAVGALVVVAVALILSFAGEPPNAGGPVSSVEPSASGTGLVPTSGPSGSGSPMDPPTESSPSVEPSRDLDAFVRRCAESSEFRTGRLSYPRFLEARVGDPVTYGAAIDVRDDPVPASSLIPGPSPDSQHVAVQCVVGARLVAVGSGVTVDAGDAVADGGWRYQQFTPAGVLEWSWNVTPSLPRTQIVRLEVRPAAQVVNGSVVLSTTSAQYETTITVAASWIDRLSYWFETQWPKLVGVAVLVAGAVTAVLVFSKDTRDRLVALRGRRRRMSKPRTPAEK
jgi:hypothetical protein